MQCACVLCRKEVLVCSVSHCLQIGLLTNRDGTGAISGRNPPPSPSTPGGCVYR